MVFKKFALLILIFQLSGCMITPRIEIPEALYFDYMQVDLTPMSYNDLLCCYSCDA